MDTYLKAADEQAMIAALASIGLEMIEGTQNGIAMTVPGIITRRIGGTDEAPIMETLDGYHANLRGELTDEQIAKLPVIPEPRNPVRVWAS